MKERIQTFFLSAGKNGCYCFCIIELASRLLNQPIDAYTALMEAVDKGFIRVDKKNYANQNNFYVLHPDSFLKYLSGKSYTVKRTTPNYKPKDGELVVECWQDRNLTHFKLPHWDSLETSPVVKYGKLVSLRVFTPIKN